VTNKRIGEILLSRGYLDEETLSLALKRQQEGERRLLGHILLDLGVLDAEKLMESLAAQWGIPYVDPTRVRVDPALVAQVSRSWVERHLAMPITRLSSGMVQVAMVNPRDIDAIRDLEFLLHATVTPLATTEKKLRTAIDRHYSLEQQAHKLLHDIDEDMRAPVVSPITLELDQKRIIGHLKGEGYGGYVDLLNFLLVNAIERHASDIHFESQANDIRIRFRIDGMLRDVLSLPKWAGPPLFSRIKVVGSLDLDGMKPQDGKTTARLGNRSVDLRIATIPSQFGEKVVIRILDPSMLKTDLGDLGWEPESMRSYYRLVSQPQGIVLCVGPTGSGKSTTLYATIQRLCSETTSIIAIEDPIEYSLPGITQIQVNPRAGMTFDRAVRSILRQDPDVIVIGEIRDANTAEVAFEAAATGHLVLSTVHTGHSVAAITRLLELGVPPYLLGSTLNGIVAQRLVRRVCRDCSFVAAPEEEDWALLGIEPRDLGDQVRRAGPGCPSCHYAGYAGRVGVFEIMTISEFTRQLLLDRASQMEIWLQARREGLVSLLEDALGKVAQGITTLEEVARVVPVDPWRELPQPAEPEAMAGSEPAVRGESAPPPLRLYPGLESGRRIRIIQRGPSAGMSHGAGPDTGATMDGAKGTAPAVVGQERSGSPPAAVEARDSSGRGSEPKAPDPASRRPVVLIADDAEEILRLVTLTLADDYDIVQARDGVEVLEKAEQQVPDLFILDVMMPRMSGFDVCEELKKRPETAPVPVLFLSARGEPPQVKRGFYVGADDYLAKPFDPEELLLRTRALLRRYRQLG